MNDMDRTGGIEAYEHFLGDYACESTPYWTRLTITRSGDGFAFASFGGVAHGELVPSEGSLTGTLFGSPMRLSRESGGDRYVFNGETLPASPGARPVPIAATLVKRTTPPSEALERRFNVRAETLVRHVRQSEQWIHHVRSLHLKAEIVWTRTPEGIAHSITEFKARFPDEDFDREGAWELRPSGQGREEVHFDDRRFRHFCSDDRQESEEIWDGRTHTTHARSLVHDEESYSIASSLRDRDDFLLAGFSWPRAAQRHRFWWAGNAPNELDESDEFGRAEEFLLVGKQDYRDVPCYVLECHVRSGDVLRWFVGVGDGLLRGRLAYGTELRSESWMDGYRQVRPGWWFPMRQGCSMIGHDDALRPFLSGRRDVAIAEIEVDEDFSDALFQLEFKEGVHVIDLRPHNDAK
ncbi:MAG: hypothetical protein ABFE01_23750 [Phycisphaerales bacterium]